MTDENNSLSSILNDGDSDQEYIVAFDFDYCDVSYEGYRILSHDTISKLASKLEGDFEVGTLNMPGSWSEEFHISKLAHSFTIYSDAPDDVANMRELFGESVGNTDYFDLVLYDLDEGNFDDSDGDGEELESPEHITLEVAEKFLEGEDSIDLSESTGIDDEAADVLSKVQGSLCLDGLTGLSDAAADALSKVQGNL